MKYSSDTYNIWYFVEKYFGKSELKVVHICPQNLTIIDLTNNFKRMVWGGTNYYKIQLLGTLRNIVYQGMILKIL